jgi:hypothetical protein
MPLWGEAAARQQCMVQSDYQSMGPGSKHLIGDDFVRALRLDKSEDNGVWKAFGLVLDELA